MNLSSVDGLRPDTGLGIYSVSKAALINLTKAMALEWGAQNVRANAICPGLIKTDFSAAMWNDNAAVAAQLARQPLPRLGTPEDVAGLALFLASDAGQLLYRRRVRGRRRLDDLSARALGGVDLEDPRGAHAAADAHRHEAATTTTALVARGSAAS